MSLSSISGSEKEIFQNKNTKTKRQENDSDSSESDQNQGKKLGRAELMRRKKLGIKIPESKKRTFG